MSELQIKSHRFRTEREESWKQLSDLVDRIERGSLNSLTDDEMIALPGLYRSTLSSLSMARAISLDQGVIEYLENLSARAYFILYGSRTNLFQKLGHFFVKDWPEAAYDARKETLASLLITIIAALVSFFLVSANPDWYYSFVPDGLAGSRNPTASADYLRSTLYDDGGGSLGAFAASLFDNNAGVCILAFTLGFAFCVPTALIMIYNGMMLGAFVALFTSNGLGYEVGGWLIIHGSTEIFAIILSGAAGYKIGWAMAFPGEQSRLSAAAKAGSSAAVLLGGCVVMMLIAGVLEAYGRQLITNDIIRYAIGFVMLALWLAYFYTPRRTLQDDFGEQS